MIRYIVIVVLGLFFGLSPKKISLKKLAVLLLVNSVLIGVLFLAGLSYGFEFKRVMLLEQNHVIISALTVFYALQLGLDFKILITALTKQQRSI